MQEALRPPSGSPIIGGQGELLGFLYSFSDNRTLKALE